MKIHILQYDDYQMKTTFPPPLYFVMKKLGMKPYKPSCCQILSDGDNDRRLQFSEIMIHRFQADPAWLRKLVFSDECNFYLNGTINKHNIHFWATEILIGGSNAKRITPDILQFGQPLGGMV